MMMQHQIITERAQIQQPIRRIPVTLQGVVDTKVKKMLELGVVRQSQIPWSFPTVIVWKKDDSVWILGNSMP